MKPIADGRTVHDLIETSDVVVDTTPRGVGAANASLYAEHHTPAIFQGGEDADVADVSFNARANFDAARDADYVRVVSCNTTGLSRIIAPLEAEYGVESSGDAGTARCRPGPDRSWPDQRHTPRPRRNPLPPRSRRPDDFSRP